MLGFLIANCRNLAWTGLEWEELHRWAGIARRNGRSQPHAVAPGAWETGAALDPAWAPLSPPLCKAAALSSPSLSRSWSHRGSLLWVAVWRGPKEVAQLLSHVQPGVGCGRKTRGVGHRQRSRGERQLQRGPPIPDPACLGWGDCTWSLYKWKAGLRQIGVSKLELAFQPVYWDSDF